MNLVLFTQHYAPHFEGGTESVVRAQACALAARGHDVRVISGTDLTHAGQDIVEERVDGLRVFFLPRHPDEQYTILLQRERLRPLIDALSEGADLAHVHHWSTLTGTLVRDLARRMPVVLTLHDFFSVCARFFRVPAYPAENCPVERDDVEPCVLCAVPDAPDYPAEVLREQMKQRLIEWPAELAAARALVTPSEAHAANLRALTGLGPDLFHVVGHGLSTPVPHEDVALDWDGSGDLRVLFLGHVGEVKGVTDLVDAAAALPDDERSRIVLTFLGEPVQAGIEETLRARARGAKIQFLGGFITTELPARIRAAGGAHLAAFPSRARETYGLVVDEAFALGLPVWVSDRGAPPERVGKAGRALPAEDPPAWTRALSELFRAPGMLRAERAAVASRGRTADDAAAALDELYRSLLAPNP